MYYTAVVRRSFERIGEKFLTAFKVESKVVVDVAKTSFNSYASLIDC
jgi:hypothetical protein